MIELNNRDDDDDDDGDSHHDDIIDHIDDDDNNDRRRDHKHTCSHMSSERTTKYLQVLNRGSVGLGIYKGMIYFIACYTIV
jgi:hypothetical protein